jgi:hypothetical protein
MNVKLEVGGHVRYLKDVYLRDKLDDMTDMEKLLISTEDSNQRLLVAGYLTPKLTNLLKTLNLRLRANYGVRLANYDRIFDGFANKNVVTLRDLMLLRGQFSFFEPSEEEVDNGIRFYISMDDDAVDRELPNWAKRSDEIIYGNFLPSVTDIAPPMGARQLTNEEYALVARAYVEGQWESTKLKNLPRGDVEAALDEISDIRDEMKTQHILQAIDYPHGVYIVAVYRYSGTKFKDGTYSFPNTIEAYFIQNGECTNVTKKDSI